MSAELVDTELAETYDSDNPGHVRYLVDTMQKGFENTREVHALAVKKGTLEILYEDDDVIVYRDNVGRGFEQAPELMGITDTDDKDILRDVHRNIASRYIDVAGDEEYFVFEKP